jgi:hypothetical protein
MEGAGRPPPCAFSSLRFGILCVLVLKQQYWAQLPALFALRFFRITAKSTPLGVYPRPAPSMFGDK